jgi:hypothetical protein
MAFLPWPTSICKNPGVSADGCPVPTASSDRDQDVLCIFIAIEG